jgi:hypothetical protein
LELIFICFLIFEACLTSYIVYKISAYSLFVIFTVIFFLSYIYPYTSKLYNFHVKFYDSLTSYEYFDEAFVIVVIFKIVFDISYLFFYKKRKAKQVIHKKDIVKFNQNKRNIILKNQYIFIILMLNTIMFFYFLGLDNLINPAGRFVGNNPTMLNVTRAIFYLLLIVVSIKSFNSNKFSILLILVFMLTLIYPMLISSRSVIFPFIITASIAVIFKKYKITLLLMILASIFLVTALYDRENVGVVNFIFKLPDGVAMLFQLIPILIDTMNSFMILTLSLDGLSNGIINLKPNPFLFIIYLSPIPSFFLPKDIYLYQSLTAHYDFTIGINSVLIPELIFWLGPYGPYLFAPFMAFIIYKIDYIIFLVKSENINILYSFYYFSMIVFILMSTVASLRASSRLLMYTAVIYFVLKLIKEGLKFEKNITTT